MCLDAGTSGPRLHVVVVYLSCKTREVYNLAIFGYI